MDDKVKDPDKTQEYYRILSHDSERLQRLVKNILDFTKIEEGKREYRLVSTDIVHLVRQEVDSFIKENQSDGLKIKIEAGSDIPPVSVDGEAMSQVVHNILDNAAKFSSQETCGKSWPTTLVATSSSQKRTLDRCYRHRSNSS